MKIKNQTECQQTNKQTEKEKQKLNKNKNKSNLMLLSSVAGYCHLVFTLCLMCHKNSQINKDTWTQAKLNALGHPDFWPSPPERNINCYYIVITT